MEFKARPVGFAGKVPFEPKTGSGKALTEPMSPPLATKARGALKAAAAAAASVSSENEQTVMNA